MFSGATGNQPSQYPHAVIPFTCGAARGYFVRQAGYAYDGSPPARSGIIADISASRKQTTTPVMVTKMMLGTEAAPSFVIITGAMPVTRIVPARPITNAPHQFVSWLRPPPS